MGTKFAMRAMEAVTIAERLMDNAEVIDHNFPKMVVKETNKRISEQTRKAAIKRHAGHAQLRERATELYLEKQYPSVNQAAKNIFPKVQEFADKIGVARLSTERVEKTVYDWLREVERSHARKTD